MSQNVVKLKKKARLDYIEKNILFKTQQEISDDCGVNLRTIQRDIEHWKKIGGLRRFILKEFFELYGKEKIENSSKALDRIITLMIRELPVEEIPLKDIKRIRIIWDFHEPNPRNQLQTT